MTGLRLAFLIFLMDTQEGIQSDGKMAALIQANCEFLTCIRHNITARTEAARVSLTTLQDYMQDRKCKLNTQAFIQLIIQLAYFYYACKNFRVTPVIEVKDIRVEESSLRNSEKRFSLVVWYKAQEAAMQEGSAMQTFISLFQYIEGQLAEYLTMRSSQKEGTIQEVQLQQSLQTFRSQLATLISQQFYKQHQPLFFLCLEQTTLFYEHSTFFKIKNCSILDYIKTDEQRFTQLRIAKVKDQSFVIQYNKQKNRGKSQQEVLRTKQREIENNISQFFKQINQKNYYQIVSKNEKDQTYRVKFNYTLKEREKQSFQDMLIAFQGPNMFRNDGRKLIDSKRAPSEIEYFIEYSSEKNHICVKLYNPSIVSNVETSDFLIFQSNVLTFDPVNVSIELTQPKLKGLQPEKSKKVVTFKGSSSFNVKQPPLEKILLLMDITMIASKIYEPQLSLNRYSSNSGKDYQRLATVSKKISHYTKMFLKCAKKIYSE